MTRSLIGTCIGILMCIAAIAVNGQRSALGSICGDPTKPCRTRTNFQPYELPFEFGRNYVVSESKLFYAVILKSVKLNADQSNCEKAIPESDRTAAQEQFPRNMVFVMRCWETGQNSYTNIADGVSFIAVYAGTTLKDANALLAKVKATGDYKGAMVRRMRIMINGT